MPRRPGPPLCGDVRRGARQVPRGGACAAACRSRRTCIRSRAARRARNWRSTSRCWAAADAADVLVLTLGNARRRRLLRLGLPGRRCCATTRSSREATTPACASCSCTRSIPYGFSHLRRTNEDNVDLNRNFRDFSTPPPPNAGVRRRARLHRAGDVAAVAGERGARSPRTSQAHGERALQAAVERRPVRVSRRPVLRRRAAGVEQRGAARRCCASTAPAPRTLGWIDFHTGLGPRGHGEKIFAGRDVAADLARAKAWWGDDVTSFHDGSSTSAPLTGVNYNAAYDECPRAAYAGIALEYGTLPFMAVLQALRARPVARPIIRTRRPTLRTAIKRAVRDAFYQDADDWKASCLRAGARACAPRAGASCAVGLTRGPPSERLERAARCRTRRRRRRCAAVHRACAPPGTATSRGASGTRRWRSCRSRCSRCACSAALFAPLGRAAQSRSTCAR